MNSSEIRIGINGFGRIGRLVCRHVLELRKSGVAIRVVAINDLSPPDYLAYQFSHDTVHGRFGESIESDSDANTLTIDGLKIKTTRCRDPVDINWKDYGADYICESTGFFTSREGAMKHLEGGAKKVIISAPPKSGGRVGQGQDKEEEIPMYVMGVNHHQYQGETIVSNASCTTNCLAPLAEILHRRFGIEMGLMTTVHAMTANQLTVDGSARGGKDWRAGRAASGNIIPASTGAAKAVGKVVPELDGRLTGMAFRVPTLDVSVVDLTCVLNQKLKLGDKEEKHRVQLCEVIEAIQEESESDRYRGIVGITSAPEVSSDFTGDTRSCILDTGACLELEDHRMMKLVAWYDNEWGYSRRLVDLIRVISVF